MVDMAAAINTAGDVMVGATFIGPDADAITNSIWRYIK